MKNENQGAIWPNDRMRQGRQDPEFQGQATIDGVEYWVSAWRRKPDAKPNAPSLSFRFNRKDENRAPRPETQPDFDDDIPF